MECYDRFGFQVIKPGNPNYEIVRQVLTPDRYPEQFTNIILPVLGDVRLDPEKLDKFLDLLLRWVSGQVCLHNGLKLKKRKDLQDAFLTPDGCLTGPQRGHAYGHLFMAHLSGDPKIKLDENGIAEHLFALEAGGELRHLVFTGTYNMERFVALCNRTWAKFNKLIEEAAVQEDKPSEQNEEADS